MHIVNKVIQQHTKTTYKNLPNNIRISVRRLELLYRRLVNVSRTVMFNLLCLKNHLFPKYTIIKVYLL